MAYSISYVYQIIDRFTPVLKAMSRSTQAFNNGMKKTASIADKIGGKLGSFQAMAGNAAAAVGGKAALDKYTGFARSMNKLESVTFANAEQMGRFRDMAKELGATTKFTAGDAAEGMTYLAMAGLNTDQVLKAIPGALQLAAAGSIDLGQAADIATNVLGQMGMSVEDLTHVNDVLAMAQSKANFNIVELFEAMRPIATTASNLGMSLEELTAHLGTMANAGEKGSIAGTLLRNALTEIAGASEKQKTIYKALGINLGNFVDKAGKIKNFKGLIGELQKLDKQGKLTVPVLQELYGDRGFRAMQILAGAGAEKIGELENKIKDSGGAAAKAANIQMKGLPGVLDSLASAIEAVNIAIFESGLDQVLIDIGNKITGWARSLSTLNPALLKAAGMIGFVLTAMAPFLIVLGWIAPAISLVASAIGAIGIGTILAVGAAFIGVGAAVYQIWKNWDYLWMDIKAGFKWIAEKIVVVFNHIPIIYAIDLIIEKWDYLVGKFQSGMDIASKIGRKIGGFFGFGPKEIKGEPPQTGVAAQNTINTRSALNGTITVAPAKGAEVQKATMETSIPGNLGFNIAGAY